MKSLPSKLPNKYLRRLACVQDWEVHVPPSRMKSGALQGHHLVVVFSGHYTILIRRNFPPLYCLYHSFFCRFSSVLLALFLFPSNMKISYAQYMYMTVVTICNHHTLEFSFPVLNSISHCSSSSNIVYSLFLTSSLAAWKNKVMWTKLPSSVQHNAMHT